MARTNPKPLTIGICAQTQEECDLFQKALTPFKEKGHTIYTAHYDVVACDVIIGPRCWRIDPFIKLGDDHTVEESLERQLELMEKGVRAVKYPKELKDAK